MSIEEFARNRLQKSAEASKVFWTAVKKRFRPTLMESEDSLELINIQELDDDCVDLVFLRKNNSVNIDQLEVCRIQAEWRLFRKPKIRIDFIPGPLKDEFFAESTETTYNKQSQAGTATPPLL